MIKKSARTIRTRKVELTISELEFAYVACSGYTTNKKPRVRTKLVNKLREALLNAVLKR